MLYNHVITSGMNNPNSLCPLDLDQVATIESGVPALIVSCTFLIFFYHFDHFCLLMLTHL